MEQTMLSKQKIVLAGFLLLTTVVRGAEPVSDPFLGKWILDPKVSKYPVNSCPTSMTIEMTREPRGVHYHSETQPAAGEPFEVDYIGNYDSKPVMVTGSRGILLPVTLRREAVNHVKASYSNAFQIVATSDRTVSNDGKLLMITTVSRDSLGQTQTNTGVYRHAESALSETDNIPRG
jgi:hypothetical protein